jgi:hypothetical protein
LVGVTLEELVAWPGSQSVTILINGREVSRKDIELSLGNNRPVIVLRGTGRLADELAAQPNPYKLIAVVPANAEQWITEVIQAANSITEKSYVPRLNRHEKVINAE